MSSTLKKVDGVSQVKADYKKHTVKIIFNDEKIKALLLKNKIESLGFKVIK